MYCCSFICQVLPIFAIEKMSLPQATSGPPSSGPHFRVPDEIPGQQAAKDTVFWFSIPLHKESLPDWLQSNSLQSFITSFKALAQLLLLLGRLRGVAPLVHCMLVLRQICDTSAVVACSRKGLCLKTPLCWT